MHGQVIVVQTPVGGRTARRVPVRRGCAAALVGLARSQVLTLRSSSAGWFAHAFEIGIRDVQLVGELPARRAASP